MWAPSLIFTHHALATKARRFHRVALASLPVFDASIRSRGEILDASASVMPGIEALWGMTLLSSGLLKGTETWKVCSVLLYSQF